MMTIARSDWKRTGCAALVAAAIALPLGYVIGIGQGEHRPSDPSARQDVAESRDVRARNFYSPQFRNDPYFIEQQRRLADALELSCSRNGEHCQEAAQARKQMREADAGR